MGYEGRGETVETREVSEAVIADEILPDICHGSAREAWVGGLMRRVEAS